MGTLSLVRKILRYASTMVLLALVLAACGGSSNNNSQGAGGGGSQSTGSVALSARTLKGLGTVLVNGQGRTLYTFAPDHAKKVSCTGSCAVVWPPLKIASGQKPSVSGGVNASLVSSLPDPSGGRVVTYKGWPLYTYQVDQQPGTFHGQGLDSAGGRWYAIQPSGVQITKQVKQTTGPKGY